MKKYIIILNILFTVVYLKFFPIITTSYGVSGISSGATPPLGVVRDGEPKRIINKDYLGYFMIGEGIFVISFYMGTRKEV